MLDSRENDPAQQGQSTQTGAAHVVPVKQSRGPFATGQIIGGAYKILDYLGQGGMGYVYRVEHLVMSRVLALKVLRSDQVSSTAWRRFQTEAQAIARLDHTNIVKIYDMNHSESGLPYYTMDLLTGESLADLLQREEILSVKDALPIFRQVCAGLAYAHDRGITHRDIKPANIMLLPPTSKNSSGAVVKIVDFGIAKLTALDGSAQQGLTKPGEVFGSPLYMSPEQCSGTPVDHRTDIYSLGITFFEALTGRTPFVGRTAVETTMMHQMEEPPELSEYGDQEFSEELERIVAKLLQKSPEERYQSLAQTASDLLVLERSTASSSNISAVHAARPQRIAAESRNNYQEKNQETTAGTQTKTLNIATGNWKRITLACAILIIAAGLVTTLLIRKDEKPLANKVALKVLPEPATVDNLPIYALYKAEIGADKLPFSTIIVKADKKIRHFEFPKDFSVGSVNYSSNGSNLCLPAQGTLEIPFDTDVQLVASGGTIQYPAILKRFQIGDLTTFQNKSIDGTNEMVRSIAQITSLRKVEMPANEIDNNCLTDLSKLTELQSLDISDTKISGSQLARTPIPKRLRQLNFKSDGEVSQLLDAMRQSKNVEHLSLERTGLTGHDLESLGTMPNLDSLTLSNNNELKAVDLKPLVKLKNLRSLDLRRCHALTPAMVGIIGQMPQLSKLYLTMEDFPPVMRKMLNQVRPNLTLRTPPSSN